MSKLSTFASTPLGRAIMGIAQEAPRAALKAGLAIMAATPDVVEDLTEWMFGRFGNREKRWADLTGADKLAWRKATVEMLAKLRSTVL